MNKNILTNSYGNFDGITVRIPLAKLSLALPEATARRNSSANSASGSTEPPLRRRKGLLLGLQVKEERNWVGLAMDRHRQMRITHLPCAF